jgi:hypothetical protein
MAYGGVDEAVRGEEHGDEATGHPVLPSVRLRDDGERGPGAAPVGASFDLSEPGRAVGGERAPT